MQGGDYDHDCDGGDVDVDDDDDDDDDGAGVLITEMWNGAWCLNNGRLTPKI